MRVFLSISLPNIIKNEIFKIQKKIESLELFQANYVRKENLHITLIFLGKIKQNTLPALIDKLDKVKFDSFIAMLRKIEIKKEKSIIWITVNSEELHKLVQNIRKNLSNFIENKTTFKAHITLARIKEIKNTNFNQIKNFVIENLRWRISKFDLVQSTLKQHGPEYKIIKSFYAIT